MQISKHNETASRAPTEFRRASPSDTYDNGGNILSKTEYVYTTGDLGNFNPFSTYGNLE